MLLRSFLLLQLLLTGLLLTGSPTLAQTTAQEYLTRIPDPKTLGESYVSDPDHLLPPAAVQELNTTLRPLDQSGRAHIDVVLTRSIGEEVPKTAATALFNKWKIGDKEKNNGLLLLLVEDQRRIEFETGYGLEADVPDIICFRIQQRYMLPFLRRAQYDEAVRQGVAALIRQLTTGQLALPDSVEQQLGLPPVALSEEAGSLVIRHIEPSNSSTWNLGQVLSVVGATVFMLITVVVLASRKQAAGLLRVGLLLGLGVIIVVLVLNMAGGVDLSPVPLVALCYGWPLLGAHAYFRLMHQELHSKYAHESRHARYTFFYGAHHGLGFLCFVFPLGLALYWPSYRRRLKALREEPYPCPKCQHLMQRLDEEQDDAALQPGQVAEERIEAIDYDVWQCPACQHQLVLKYANLSSDAEVCTKCRHRTAQPQPDQEMRAATTSHSGWGWHVRKCAFCQHVKKTKYTIAKISSSSGSSSSSSSSFSSSSSSSSSSSGGSSGGGGAGSSW